MTPRGVTLQYPPPYEMVMLTRRPRLPDIPSGPIGPIGPGAPLSP